MVGYFEDQAVVSYTHYLEEIDAGRTENIPAPKIARDYYKLAEDATLRDVVVAVRTDEQGHADVNHGMADTLNETKHKV
jgi:ubiquinol oxidase